MSCRILGNRSLGLVALLCKALHGALAFRLGLSDSCPARCLYSIPLHSRPNLSLLLLKHALSGRRPKWPLGESRPALRNFPFSLASARDVRKGFKKKSRNLSLCLFDGLISQLELERDKSEIGKISGPNDGPVLNVLCFGTIGSGRPFCSPTWPDSADTRYRAGFRLAVLCCPEKRV